MKIVVWACAYAWVFGCRVCVYMSAFICMRVFMRAFARWWGVCFREAGFGLWKNKGKADLFSFKENPGLVDIPDQTDDPLLLPDRVSECGRSSGDACDQLSKNSTDQQSTAKRTSKTSRAQRPLIVEDEAKESNH